MTVENENVVVLKCDNCGEKFRRVKPKFTYPYELAMWEEQCRLCDECTQINVEPRRIRVMKNPNPKGANWKPAEHDSHYLSDDLSEEEMNAMAEKEKEIRKANMALQKVRLKEEFKR